MSEVEMLVSIVLGLALICGLWALGKKGIVPFFAKIPSIGWGALVLFMVYVVCAWLIPVSFTSSIFMGDNPKPQPVPIPATATALYLLFAIVGVLVYVGTDQKKFAEFIAPIQRLLRGEGLWAAGLGVLGRKIVLAIVPLFIGLLAFQLIMPKVASPSSLRIAHPTMPKKYELEVNPFEAPTKKMLDAFVAELKAGKFAHIPDDGYQQVLSTAKGGGQPDAAALKRAYRLRINDEGRDLYMINCRPCHGTKADGGGPMGRGFRVAPADFTDSGTIATITEGYALWRVLEGGPALPAAGAPWDSAMPIWEIDITKEEAWKIILAEYDTAGTVPRKPEKLHGVPTGGGGGEDH